jgi:Ca-activated chloride channel family protein
MAEEFILESKVDQPAVLAGQAADLFVLLTIKPNPAQLGRIMDSGSDTALPAHLIVVVDVSGSMNTIIREDPNARVVGSGMAEGQTVSYIETTVPTRLVVAQGVVKRLIERMGPSDRLTLVAFDHQAYPLATGLSAAQSADLRGALEQLAETGGGGTSMGKGFQAVLKGLGRQADGGATRRLVLLTDGEEHEPELALEQARILGEEHHIPIHAFGTGDCRVEFLTQIAKATPGGVFDHIKDENEANQVFEKVFTGQKNILATNVGLSLWLSPEIFVQELYRTQPEILYMGAMRPDGENKVVVPIAYMEKGRVYEFLFQCKVPAREAGRRFRLVKATLGFDLPALQLAGQKVEANIVIEYTDDRDLALVRVGDVRRIIAKAEVQRQVLFLQKKIDAVNAGSASANDQTVIARLLDTLIKKYEEFGDQANANQYRTMQQEFRDGKTISQEMLNRSLAASSKVEETITVVNPDF